MMGARRRLQEIRRNFSWGPLTRGTEIDNLGVSHWGGPFARWERPRVLSSDGQRPHSENECGLCLSGSESASSFWEEG